MSIKNKLKPILFLLVMGLTAFYSKVYAQRSGNGSKAQLLGRSVLKAASFADGPTSGTRIGEGPINQQEVPFLNRQPVQGVSAVLRGRNGALMVMSDNGFGSLENSADYNLRVYTLKPNFNRTGGNMVENGYFELHDPDRKIPFAIANHFSSERILTGADFDLESFQRAKDGTFWFGDEFGPFLLHTDANGKVLEAPIPLPDFDNPGKFLKAPQNPNNEEYSALRILNAVRKHALSKGNETYPVFSPWFVMLDDDSDLTKVGSRENPPTGLEKASSELFNVRSIQRAGFPVVVYTVNDVLAMEGQLDLGVDGIISDRPDLLLEVLKSYDKDNDGQADFITSEGLINSDLFDAQGHRGARNLRPENTLPSIEAALDYLMTTLEFDCGITKDNIPVLDHDPYIEASKVRKSDGSVYSEENEVLVKSLTLLEIQETFVADKLLGGRPDQQNDLNLSPVSVAFANESNILHPYAMPSLTQVFNFVKYYENYYKTGAGAGSEDADLKWKNAAKVRFNIETKINPRTDADAKGNAFIDRTKSPSDFVENIGEIIANLGLEKRADIQSFDFRSLLLVHEKYPEIRTVCLFGDFPKVGDAGDGTNLQDQNGENTPWLAGLYWPYRTTKDSDPFNVRGSGGFEGMALTADGNYLLPLLEKPLVGGEDKTLLIHEFHIKSQAYTGKKYKYLLNDRGTAIGDFIMFSEKRGLIIERDGSQGDLDGFKKVYEIELFQPDNLIGKREALDLLDIQDSRGVSSQGLPGDVGIGENFAFPFVTIESVLKFNDNEIGILNDNNYPFSVGRHVGAGLPDDTEFIRVRLTESLGEEVIASPSNIEVESINDGEPNSSINSSNLKAVIYPNPFEDKLNIVLRNDTPGKAIATLTDINGKILWQKTEEVNNSPKALKIDLSTNSFFPKGIYLIKILYPEGESFSYRVHKR